jgi:hypothetical protein
MVLNVFKYQVPQLEYALFKTYIAQNLCVFKEEKNNHCHGRCHLEKQLKMVDKSSEDKQTNPSQHSSNSKKNQNNEENNFIGSHVLTPKPVETSLFLPEDIEAAKLQGYASAIYVPPKG